MSRVHDELQEIERLFRIVKPNDAEERCRGLIAGLSPEDLAAFEDDLRRTIAVFLPKRRRALLEALTAALRKDTAEGLHGNEVNTATSVGDSTPLQHPSLLDLHEMEGDLRNGLAELSDRHIFQWSTFYRDYFAPRFARWTDAVVAPSGTDEVLRLLHREIAAHANEIFKKGYEYVSSRPGQHQHAVGKSLAGLQRFLELPIELYSSAAANATSAPRGIALRRTCSAIVSGILEGYGSVRFGDEEGWQLLPRLPRSWAHYLGFLTWADLAPIVQELEPGPFRHGVAASVLPVVEAIDSLLARPVRDYIGLPLLGQLVWDSRRLEIALQPPPEAPTPRLIEIQSYLDPGFINLRVLDEAASRGVALITGALRADIQEQVESRDVLRNIVVNTRTDVTIVDSDHEMTDILARRAEDVLRFAVSFEVAAGLGTAPLTYNFASSFPLHNPFLTKYFHVYRTSVRDLLRAFERRNGVRLWCSVRRSGKTTACFDLSTTTGTSTVVAQTCDTTDPRFEANLFYDQVVACLANGAQLPNTFFQEAVEACSPDRRASDYRYVFVLDEYETLFERLRLAAMRDRELRYAVVQPLLNQMVAFSRDNLIVFIGQRPDAHFILMDQNQLSAYVQQDSFPLFTHSVTGGSSEFRELLRRVLTERIVFDAGFANAVYNQTGGHPFLTVKLLVAFFEWLIAQRRPVRSLQLTGGDFQAFVEADLSNTAVAMGEEYAFFRESVSEALSSDGRSQTPWLHAIYTCLRRIATDSPDTLTCTRAEFHELVSASPIGGELGYTPEYLLSTGAQANFLAYSDTTVWPRVPLLARIAKAARPRVAW